VINVAKWALLAGLALPILELAVFIAMAAIVGFGWALSLVLAGSLIGLRTLRHLDSAHNHPHAGCFRPRMLYCVTSR
jgi:FxsA membrane protein